MEEKVIELIRSFSQLFPEYSIRYTYDRVRFLLDGVIGGVVVFKGDLQLFSIRILRGNNRFSIEIPRIMYEDFDFLSEISEKITLELVKYLYWCELTLEMEYENSAQEVNLVNDMFDGDQDAYDSWNDGDSLH